MVQGKFSIYIYDDNNIKKNCTIFFFYNRKPFEKAMHSFVTFILQERFLEDDEIIENLVVSHFKFF